MATLEEKWISIETLVAPKHVNAADKLSRMRGRYMHIMIWNFVNHLWNLFLKDEILPEFLLFWRIRLGRSTFITKFYINSNLWNFRKKVCIFYREMWVETWNMDQPLLKSILQRIFAQCLPLCLELCSMDYAPVFCQSYSYRIAKLHWWVLRKFYTRNTFMQSLQWKYFYAKFTLQAITVMKTSHIHTQSVSQFDL